MATRIILDGALLSECLMMGSNRHGMLRMAEHLTEEFIKNKEFDIFFANTIYNSYFSKCLKRFVLDNYPSHKSKILSKDPFPLSRWKSMVSKVSHRLPQSIGRSITQCNDFIVSHLSDYLSGRVNIGALAEYDIFHSFHHPFPKSIENKKIKKTITFLDVFPLKLKGYSINLIEQVRKIVESIVPNFAISISEFSKQDLINYDRRIDPKRIFVSPLAASKELFFRNIDSDNWRFVKDKYKLPDNYFLSICSNDPRKNVYHLIKCFRKFFLQEKPKDLFLVLAGNWPQNQSILEQLEIDRVVRKNIIILEKFIDNEDLSAIYSNSLCFFFMSIYEGFGLPVLEAMQCGTPVVTSNATSLPEVVGKAGIMLDPKDEDALAEVMNKMYLNPKLRNIYSQLGLKRATQFSWERSAQEYTEIFKTIISNT